MELVFCFILSLGFIAAQEVAAINMIDPFYLEKK
jgi:hypothetical protein